MPPKSVKTTVDLHFYRPIRPPSKNETVIKLRNGRIDGRAWFPRWFKKWKQELLVIRQHTPDFLAAREKRIVDLIVWWPCGGGGRTRLPDEKNVEYGLAPLWDAMVDMAFLKDDSPKWFQGNLKVRKMSDLMLDGEVGYPIVYHNLVELAKRDVGMTEFFIYSED